MKHKLPKKFLFLIAGFLLLTTVADPVGTVLNNLTGSVLSFDWSSPFRLGAMLCGLIVLYKLAGWFFGRFEEEDGRRKTLINLAHSAVRYAIVILGILWSLYILGIDLNTLFASVGILTLVVGFGAESLIADVITGIFMMFEGEYNVGDIVEIDGFRGTVKEIGIRTTSIQDGGGNVKVINNSNITDLVNRSTIQSCAVSEVCISYEEDLARVEKVIGKILSDLHKEKSDILPNLPEYVGVHQLTADGMLLRTSAVVEEKNIFSAQRLMNRAIILGFQKENIQLSASHVRISQEK